MIIGEINVVQIMLKKFQVKSNEKNSDNDEDFSDCNDMINDNK